MKRYLILLLSFGLLWTTCSFLDSLFYQNDFLHTVTIEQIGNEEFVYSAFKTGIDNYRIEFTVVVNKDTSKIFDYYINDAVYTKERTFHFRTIHDTLIVFTPLQSCKSYYKTKNGTTIELTKDHETKVCDE